MKRMFAPVVGALLVIAMPANAAQQPSPAQAPDPAKLAEAHAIIEIMFPPAERERAFDTIMRQLTARARTVMPAYLASDPGLSSIFANYLDTATAKASQVLASHLPQLFEAMAGAYTREFSLVELQDIHAFALTPAGRHYLSRSTAVVGDPAVAKFNADLMFEEQQQMAPLISQLKDNVAAYLKAHPHVAGKLAAEGIAK